MANRKHIALALAFTVLSACASHPANTHASPQAPEAPATPNPSNTSEWIAPSSIPLYQNLHWPDLATTGHIATSPQLTVENACGSTPPPWRTHIEQAGYSAQAAPFGPHTGGDWQGQQLILSPPGTGADASHAGRSAFNEIVGEITNACSPGPSGADATVTWQGNVMNTAHKPAPVAKYSGIVSTISASPLGEVHDYVLVSYCHQTAHVTELALWATQPSTPWSADDTAVLNALNDGICGPSAD